ncbi:MAG: PhoU domain-containing protein, partial [Clostridia bacterium]
NDSNQISKYLHTLGDFERIGDHSVNIVKSVEELNDKKIAFSDDAQRELAVISAALHDIIDTTTESFANADVEKACMVEPLEQVIDGLISEAKTRHILRLQNGECTIKLGFVFSDMLSNFERVSDHCSNIAVAMIEVSQSSFDTHEYLNSVKSNNNDAFQRYYALYKDKYII